MFAELSIREKIVSVPKKLISKIQERKMQQRFLSTEKLKIKKQE
jgi:hypothetical protein